MRLTGRFSLLVCVVVMLAPWPRSEAFVGALLEGLGELIGRPVGGLLRAAAEPATVMAREQIGLAVADLDSRVEKRIDQVDDAVARNVSAAVAEVDGVAERRLGQVDGILGARIAQVQGAGAQLVQVATENVQGTIDRTLKQVNVVAAERVADVDRRTKARIAQVDGVVDKTLEKVDRIAESRIAQVRRAGADTLREADTILDERIGQLDESVGRRLGNVDTIVSKQLISVEAVLLKVVSISGLVVLLIIGTWVSLKNRPTPASQPRLAMVKTLASVALSWGLALSAAGVLYWIGLSLPGGSVLRLRAMRVQHDEAFRTSLTNFDLTTARFHASQLSFLASVDSPSWLTSVFCWLPTARLQPESCRAAFEQLLSERQVDLQLRHVTLLRDLVVKPGLLGTPEGRTELLARLAELRLLVGNEAAHAGWRAELEALSAAVQAADATDANHLPTLLVTLDSACRTPAWNAGAGEVTGATIHRIICRAATRVRLASPSADWLTLIGREVPSALRQPPNEVEPLVPTLAAFFEQSAVKHAAFLEAHARVCREAGPGCKGKASAAALETRQQAALAFAATWAQLLTQVNAAQETPVALLLLDDAALSAALAVDAAPATALMTKLADRPLLVRERSLPPRLLWAKDVFGQRSPAIQSVAGIVEAQRFEAYETMELSIVQQLTQANTKRSPLELARLVTILELKGLLGEALAKNWMNRTEAVAAMQAVGPLALPIRRWLD
jgi:hypothetical protein